MDLIRKQYSESIKKKVLELGFAACGIAKADFLPEHHTHALQYLDNNYQGEMDYLNRNIEKRSDPRLLVKNAKSVIIVADNYFPSKTPGKSRYKIARYAYGKDYHKVIKDRLHELFGFISENIQKPEHYRIFSDSAPVLERAWAMKAGLGWIGKNSNLLIPRKGSFFFLGEIILDIELASDDPFEKDMCSRCTRCIDACPTGAIVGPQKVDGSKCISYATIETKNEIPAFFKGKMKDWIYGCDICQEVCPYNFKAKAHSNPEYEPKEELLEMTDEDWENLSEEKFKTLFKDTAVTRAGFKGLKRNVEFVQEK